jgi:complement component 1 Q subcomponent-binding protein, mitochondrial
MKRKLPVPRRSLIVTDKFPDSIKVVFTIADMNAMDEDHAEMDEDVALGDEDGDLVDEQPRSRRTINQSGAKGGSADVIAPADAQREDEDAMAEPHDSSGFPAQLNITVTKPGKGAIQFTATADDGLIEVEDVFYFPNAALAEPNTAEKMHARQHVYAGPPFGNLDSDLQAMLERYLDERGINTQLATFVPDYIDYKEQREYVQWLESKSIGQSYLQHGANKSE